MKAKIITQMISDSNTDDLHGFKYKLRRLVIEEMGNLAITIYRNQVIVLTDFEISGDCQIICEVEVPYRLVRRALNLAIAQERLDELKDILNDLLLNSS